MSPTKQRLLGGIILMIGGALLAILLLGRDHTRNLLPGQSGDSKSASLPDLPVKTANNGTTQEQIDSRPLALDIETERKMLEEARKNRLKQVQEQDQKAAEFLQAQQQAETEAARRANAEQEHVKQRALDKTATSKSAAEESAMARAATSVKDEVSGLKNPPATESHRSSIQQEAEKLTGQVTQTAEQLKEKNRQEEIRRLKAEKQLQERIAKEITQKKDEEIRRLKEEKAKLLAAQKEKAVTTEKEPKTNRENSARHLPKETLKDPVKDAGKELQKAREALVVSSAGTDSGKTYRQKLEDARQQSKTTREGSGNWVVQVAIARDQASADSIVARLRAKGYPVKTSPTTKGVRIMVGPEKAREPALVVKRQIDSDPSLGVNGAWIMNWQPSSN